jgi:hypothetical protein
MRWRTGFPSAANTSGMGAPMRIDMSEISDMSIRMNEGRTVGLAGDGCRDTDESSARTHPPR